MKKQMQFIWVILWLCVMIPLVLHADVFLKQKVHTDAFEMMGQTQPAKDMTQTTWLTSNGIRNDNDEQSIIIRADKNTMIILDHKQKAYREIPLNLSEMAKSVGAADAQDSEDMQKMMAGMMKFKMTVTPTKEKKKINGWNCTKYLQQLDTPMGPSTTEVWASEDVKVNFELYSKLAVAMFAQMPGMSENMAELNKELKKIKGVNVLTNTSMTIMGNVMKTGTQLLEVKEEAAPAGILNIPSGYKKMAN